VNNQPLENLRQVRIDKLQKIREMGVDPYPAETPEHEVIAEVRTQTESKVSAVGRLMGIRGHGKLIFADLKDESGQIQLCFKADILEGGKFELVKLLDIGDFIWVSGDLFTTTAGELTIQVQDLKLLSKSLRPLPSEYYGLKDMEERYRRRYLDLILREESKKVLDARWKIEQETRKFLWGQGFTEVETPVLQPLYGGTNAKPFTTHFNALDSDFYLRVAPELYLKRLVVGGYERVFEIARNFRNEGIDHSHFPEFTMLEWYESYADYNRVMDLAEELIRHLVKALTGDTKLTVKENIIDVGPKWPRIPIEGLIKEHLGVTWDEVSEDEVKKLQRRYQVEAAGTWSREKALFAIFDKEVTPKILMPTWTIDYPASVSPLSRAHRSKPGRAERFEGYIGGVEVFDGWSEIISGLEQRDRFEVEQKNMKAGYTDAMPLDEDFIEALEYGMPPLGGIGFGIERLTMFLTNTWAIKEVVAFPTLRPDN